MANIRGHFSYKKKQFEIFKNAARFHVHVSWIAKITSQEPLNCGCWVLMNSAELDDLTDKIRASVSGLCAHSSEFDCIKFYLRSNNNVTVTMAPAVTTCCSSSSTTSSYYKACFMTKRFNRKNPRFRFRFVRAFNRIWLYQVLPSFKQ